MRFVRQMNGEFSRDLPSSQRFFGSSANVPGSPLPREILETLAKNSASDIASVPYGIRMQGFSERSIQRVISDGGFLPNPRKSGSMVEDVIHRDGMGYTVGFAGFRSMPLDRVPPALAALFLGNGDRANAVLSGMIYDLRNVENAVRIPHWLQKYPQSEFLASSILRSKIVSVARWELTPANGGLFEFSHSASRAFSGSASEIYKGLSGMPIVGNLNGQLVTRMPPLY